MILIIYAYPNNGNVTPTSISSGNWLSKDPTQNMSFLTIGVEDYINPNPNMTYIILKESVLKKALYWAPRWNSIYTSDKYKYYYNSKKTPSQNLSEWVNVYTNTYSDYNPSFTYNEFGIPQNEIVFTKSIDLEKYGDWIIY